MDDKTAMYEKGRSMMETVLEIPFTDKAGPSRMAISMYTCFEGGCERPGYPEEFARGIIDAVKEKDMRLAKILFCVLRKEPIEVSATMEDISRPAKVSAMEQKHEKTRNNDSQN